MVLIPEVVSFGKADDMYDAVALPPNSLPIHNEFYLNGDIPIL